MKSKNLNQKKKEKKKNKKYPIPYLISSYKKGKKIY